MVSIDTNTNITKSVQTDGHLRLLLSTSFIFVLLFCPAVAFAAEKSDYTVFDYIIGFVAMDIIFSIMWYLLKK